MAYFGIGLLWTAIENPALRGACSWRNGCTQPPSLFWCCIGFSFTGLYGSQCSPVFCWRAVQTGITQSVCRQTTRVLLSCSSTSRVETLLLLYLSVPVPVWAGMHLLVPVPFRHHCPSLSSAFNSTLLSPSPDQLPVPLLWKAAACIRELPKLSIPWAVKLCCFKVTLTSCCSKRVQHLLPLFRMRELQSNIKKAARALNYSAMEHCHSSIKLLWPVVFYGVHCS